MIRFVLMSLFISLTSGKEFYSLSATDIRGQVVQFEQYRGKVLLIVNVASECGYTRVNYNELGKLRQLFALSHPNRFEILAFPCNQFGNQEPGQSEDIIKFAQKHNAEFPLFEKINVFGDAQAEVYGYLVDATGSTPQWNFCKYLVDQTGDVVEYFNQLQSFNDIEATIKHLLDAKHSEL